MSLKWQHLKDKGNDEFKKQNYTTAISLYTDSLSKILINKKPKITK
jgi:hypothetical protein